MDEERKSPVESRTVFGQCRVVWAGDGSAKLNCRLCRSPSHLTETTCRIEGAYFARTADRFPATEWINSPGTERRHTAPGFGSGFTFNSLDYSSGS